MIVKLYLRGADVVDKEVRNHEHLGGHGISEEGLTRRSSLMTLSVVAALVLIYAVTLYALAAQNYNIDIVLHEGIAIAVGIVVCVYLWVQESNALTLNKLDMFKYNAYNYINVDEKVVSTILSELGSFKYDAGLQRLAFRLAIDNNVPEADAHDMSLYILQVLKHRQVDVAAIGAADPIPAL
jgi:hypothetical protein